MTLRSQRGSAGVPPVSPRRFSKTREDNWNRSVVCVADVGCALRGRKDGCNLPSSSAYFSKQPKRFAEVRAGEAEANRRGSRGACTCNATSCSRFACACNERCAPAASACAATDAAAEQSRTPRRGREPRKEA
eukprot:3240909-Pleurochrysis_carterae.AAC.1